MNTRIASLILLGGLAGVSLAPVTFAVDQAAEKNLTVEKTAGGDLGIQPINHSALRFEYRGRQYYVDPAGRADWANLPKADAIFITHEHGDHLSPPTIALLKKEGTLIFANASSVKEAGLGTVIEVGEKKSVLDIVVEAGLKLHDFAALVPVVEGAGGRMCDWQGDPLHAGSNGEVIAAGDPARVEEILEALACRGH